MADEPRYAIGDLAALGGVSRRTVRYYVHEGLLPPPLGIGRGNHYGPAHLQQLLRVKALQEAGRTLDEIRRAFDGTAPRSRVRAVAAAPPDDPLPRAVWRRLILGPGVELHVSADVHLPSPGKLHELAAWCRANLPAPPAHAYEPATPAEEDDA
jgi:DNA-binding transcriptional MerR regulator